MVGGVSPSLTRHPPTSDIATSKDVILNTRFNPDLSINDGAPKNV
jgi:hypothetical protein